MCALVMDRCPKSRRITYGAAEPRAWVGVRLGRQLIHLQGAAGATASPVSGCHAIFTLRCSAAAVVGGTRIVDSCCQRQKKTAVAFHKCLRKKRK
mmetsp:Transcript_135177/g.263282  ORF Transcript_135177/g.263282 Transcript_135177/m.263282 type:complete len:95 (+) Transcript_135177:248-532(+)